MSRWQADDSYEDFVRAHRPELLRLAILLAGDRGAGEDALQDALISVARSWPRVRQESALAYVRTSVARQAGRARSRASKARVTPVADREPADHGYLRFEEDRAVVRLLAALPHKQRAVLVLRYCFDLSDKVVAQTVGCSEATVRSQAHRALHRLRQQVSATEGMP